MDTTFEDACKATAPYIEPLLKYFEDSLMQGIFLQDEEGFLKLKHQHELLERIKQTILNNTPEVTTNE